MSRNLIPILVILVLFSYMIPPVTATAGDDAVEPERIVSKRIRILPPGRYEELRAEWEAFTEARPDDPLGWSQLARAARYAGAPCEEYIPYAEKAVRLGPDDPLAHATLGFFCWKMYCGTQEKDPGRAIGELETALRLDPSLGEPHFTLWVMRLSEKDRAGATEELRAIFDGGHLPDLLVDRGRVEPDQDVALVDEAAVSNDLEDQQLPAIAFEPE